MRTSQILKKIKPGTFIFFVFLYQNLFASFSPTFAFSNSEYFDIEEISQIPVNVIRGPYLQSGTPNSMVVRWRTDADTESVVRYGTSQNVLDQTTQDLTLKSEHEITITGLSSETVYYYEVADLTDTLVYRADDLYFKTSPLSGQTMPVNIWVLGDCGTANDDARDVRDAYYNYNGSAHIDLLVLLGDNAYSDGTDLEYQDAIFENMYEDRLKNTVLWSTLGNHDGHSVDSDTQTGPYFDIFTFPKSGEAGGVGSGTEAYYSFDYANIHFLVLNSYDVDRNVGSPMYLWAESDIQNTTADWIIAFWHHPTYSRGSHDSDNCSQCSDMRENFLPLLESNGVDLVLAGHSHSYERSYLLNGHYDVANTFDPAAHIVQPTGDGDGKIDGDGAYEKDLEDTEGAVYIVAGSSGKTSSGTFDHPAHYFSVKELGSLSISVNDNELDAKFVRETGAIDDYFTIIKLLALPIELLSFNAESFRQNVKLTWQTASEDRNLGFEIYRSTDSDPERTGWKKIGWMDGKGTTSETQYYSFYDERPLSGTNYYRLKQMDMNGNYEFTDIVSADFLDENVSVHIFPNPAKSEVFIKTTEESSLDEICVFDLSGNALIKTKLLNQALDISKLKNGIYLLEMKIDQRVYQERLVVIR
jgi:hypothetical protein